MPHSVSPEANTTSNDTVAPEEAMVDSPVQPAASQATDGDVAMAEVDAPAPATEEKKDVKLTSVEFTRACDATFADVSWPASIGGPRANAGYRDIADLKASDPEVMRSFYQRLFPWRYLFQWLNHSPSPTNDFGHREFAFTLQNDAYLRYQSFATHDLLRKDVLRLMPSRFEIGPVYSTNPRDRKTLRNASAFKPLAKELCFDIDLTDYDEIRTCCDKANICIKCWQFITMAIKVVDIALRDDFGFKHIMWVYSGRRGAHAWVCDKKARIMGDQMRRSIAGYLEVIKGGAQSGKKVNLWRPLHPHLSRSLETLKSHFQEDVLEAQDPWASNERAERLLQLLPDKNLNESLRKKWDAAPGRSSVSKWADIDTVAKSGASKNLDAKALLEAKQDIVLEYTYPRLDIEVSKKLNHLLKSPFVVHPGTGRVCVPINTKNLEDFDPLGVPTVQSLLAEIDAWKGEEDAEGGSQQKSVQDWEKTSLKPYVEQFRSFVIGLMKDEREGKVKREREEDAMEF
ncbi:putative eukaryotic and archaeal DNA primase small subunit [Colletotrichum sublineola]|uniref:DNA primase n=1 Tax=Colletotrichum sublineola TaxID=1173701 RepID=A0A066X933_COLSU|nr:putative eukaryotic and archaeal DNA primase small subunit [Colletotrichum sublineola]